jgi:hypothetical protein
MPALPTSSPVGADPDGTRRILAAWVADQADRLDPVERTALDADLPGWRAEAAQLIAEGLLAYVVLEMIAPDLAIARAEGAQAHTDDAALTERLMAHLQEFIDYRADLNERGGLPLGGPCEHGHRHNHQRRDETADRRAEATHARPPRQAKRDDRRE